jgi:hypothetical protein
MLLCLLRNGIRDSSAMQSISEAGEPKLPPQPIHQNPDPPYKGVYFAPPGKYSRNRGGLALGRRFDKTGHFSYKVYSSTMLHLKLRFATFEVCGALLFYHGIEEDIFSPENTKQCSSGCKTYGAVFR